MRIALRLIQWQVIELGCGIGKGEGYMEVWEDYMEKPMWCSLVWIFLTKLGFVSLCFFPNFSVCLIHCTCRLGVTASWRRCSCPRDAPFPSFREMLAVFLFLVFSSVKCRYLNAPWEFFDGKAKPEDTELCSLYLWRGLMSQRRCWNTEHHQCSRCKRQFLMWSWPELHRGGGTKKAQKNWGLNLPALSLMFLCIVAF